MKTWQAALIGALVLIQSSIVTAGEDTAMRDTSVDGRWSLRLGVSYRDFDNIKFGDGEFRNFGQQEGEGPFGVQNISSETAFPDFGLLNADYVRYNGGGSGDFDDTDHLAPIIGFRYEFAPSGNWQWSIVGNFQYYNLESGNGASGSSEDPGDFTYAQYQHFVGFGIIFPIPEGDLPNDPPEPGTTFSVRNKFDLNLYVLDLGVEGRANWDNFHLSAAVGPTLTIADMDSSQTQSASWAAQGVDLLPAGSYSEKIGDSETKIMPGVYGAVGATVDLSDRWSVGVEGRYDWVSDNAGNGQADLDLSGFSGIVSVMFRF